MVDLCRPHRNDANNNIRHIIKEIHVKEIYASATKTAVYSYRSRGVNLLLFRDIDFERDSDYNTGIIQCYIIIIIIVWVKWFVAESPFLDFIYLHALYAQYTSTDFSQYRGARSGNVAGSV